MYILTDQRQNDMSRLIHPGSFQGLGFLPVIPILTMAPACIGKRDCCLLAPTWSIDPLSLGNHHGSNERNGIIYTGGAGFIDTGHVRHCCDDTKHVYDQLVASSGALGKVATSHGVATIVKPVPANMRTQVARAISYSDSVGYEIDSYWMKEPGGHHSAFSPEDLCSNYLGTFIAETAINTRVAGPGSNFDATVTATLNAFLTTLKAQSIVETQKAFNLIINCWVTPNPSYSISNRLAWDSMTLNRRNFSIAPWKVGHSSDFPTPSWVTQGLGTAPSFYAYTHSKERSHISPGVRSGPPTLMPEASFATEITAIRKDAEKLYLNKYDQPACP